MITQVSAVVLGDGDVRAEFALLENGSAAVVFYDEGADRVVGVTFKNRECMERFVDQLDTLCDIAFGDDDEIEDDSHFAGTFIPWATLAASA